MNTPFSDYSKPAYFYRLFHEGRPKPLFFDLMLDCTMPWWLKGCCYVASRNEFFQHRTPAGKPATTVDPLDGVW